MLVLPHPIINHTDQRFRDNKRINLIYVAYKDKVYNFQDISL